MTIKKILIDQCVCDLCGKEWIPKNGIPKSCVRCKRYDWNKKQEKQ